MPSSELKQGSWAEGRSWSGPVRLISAQRNLTAIGFGGKLRHSPDPMKVKENAAIDFHEVRIYPVLFQVL